MAFKCMPSLRYEMPSISRVMNASHLIAVSLSNIFLQTAACLVVGELATKDMVVVLNKVDQLPEEGRSKVINKAKKRLRQTLGSTKFGGCAMVPTAVKPGIQCTLSHSPGAYACCVPLSLEYSMSHMLNKNSCSGQLLLAYWLSQRH